jgi:hypothetical protein
MPDNFLTTVITDMAIMRVDIDAMPNDSTRDLLEREFDAKFRALESAVPADLRHKIGEMVEAEVARHKQK